MMNLYSLFFMIRLVGRCGESNSEEIIEIRILIPEFLFTEYYKKTVVSVSIGWLKNFVCVCNQI